MSRTRDSLARAAAALSLLGGYGILCRAPWMVSSRSPGKWYVHTVVSFYDRASSAVDLLLLAAVHGLAAVAAFEIAKILLRRHLSRQGYLVLVLTQIVAFFDAIRASTWDWWVYVYKLITFGDFRVPWENQSIPISSVRWPWIAAIAVAASLYVVWRSRPIQPPAFTKSRAAIASALLVAGYVVTFSYPIIERHAFRWPMANFAVPGGKPVSVGLLFAGAGLGIIAVLVSEIGKRVVAPYSLTSGLLAALAQIVLAADLIRAYLPDWWYVITMIFGLRKTPVHPYLHYAPDPFQGAVPLPGVPWPLFGGLATILAVASIWWLFADVTRSARRT